MTRGEGQVASNDKKRHDPLLKLYIDRPSCKDINVKRCIANGAMCKFIGINLNEGGEGYVERNNHHRWIFCQLC